MRKALIILASSNPQGLGHKTVFKNLRYILLKSDIEYTVVDLYREGFDPMVNKDIVGDMLTKAYMHYVKTSTEIHIITNSHLGGMSPAIEGFFERIIKNDFAYSRVGTNRKSRLKSKDVYFYISSTTKRFKYNLLYLRLKLIVGKLFKTSTVFQLDPKTIFDKGKREYNLYLSNLIRKSLNKNRS